jgi:hypothetical protein
MSSIKTPETITYRRLAIFMITIGLLFGIDSLLKLSFVYKFWPVIISILGLGLGGIYINKMARGTLFLAVGEYLFCFSLLALYCNFTTWRNMAHLWPLFIVFLGVVFVTVFLCDRKRRYFLLLGLLLLSLAICFFFIFSLGSQFWWIIFILTGLSILISGGVT